MNTSLYAPLWFLFGAVVFLLSQRKQTRGLWELLFWTAVAAGFGPVTLLIWVCAKFPNTTVRIP